MKHGPGWVILEESRESDPTLLSILSPRRSKSDVAAYMQQLYVDRSSSVEEKLLFKKRPRDFPYKVMSGPHPNPMHVGHDPFLVAVYADSISLKNSELRFEYKILMNPADPPQQARFEKRSQTLAVGA